MKLLALGIITLAAYTGPSSPEISRWFNSLKDANGASCCDISDGHVLRSNEFRTAGDYWEVRLNDSWVRVPPEKVLHNVDNPMGSAVVFHNNYGTIFCFVRPAES